MRVHTVAKARKSKKPRQCVRGGEHILEGEWYQYCEPRLGPRKCFCFRHPPQGSDLATGRMSSVLALQEGLDDDIAAFRNGEGDGLDLSTAASEARALGEEYTEAADAQLEAFPSGNPTIELCNESAEALDQWADELEGVDTDLEPEDVDEVALAGDLGLPDDLDADDREERINEAVTTAKDEADQQARDTVADEAETASASLSM